MKIYPIYHSCFYVELAHCDLLFDYWQGNLPARDPEKPLYVFVSHGHYDHYNPEILNLRETNAHCHYLVSGAEHPAYLNVQPDQTLQLDGMTVQTLGSTDEGVAFLVQAEGWRIFHAGDLHLWYWDGDTPAERQQMYDRYRAELAKLENAEIDVAFLVLDDRQSEADAPLGIELFQRMTRTRRIFPMHNHYDAKQLEQKIQQVQPHDVLINTRRKLVYEI